MDLTVIGLYKNLNLVLLSTRLKPIWNELLWYKNYSIDTNSVNQSVELFYFWVFMVYNIYLYHQTEIYDDIKSALYNYLKLFTRVSERDRGMCRSFSKSNDPVGRRINAYANKQFSEKQKRYAAVERKCFVIIWATNKFRLYIEARRFELFTKMQP